jgi:SLT domain-containing protein
MWRERERGLIVHIPSVTNAQNIHGKGAVVNGINHAIVPYTDTPEVVGIRQFLAAGRGVAAKASIFEKTR